MRSLKLGIIFIISASLNAGVVLLESTFSSGGSESSSSSFFLRQGIGQSITGQDASSNYVEQAGFYNWFLYVNSGVGVKEPLKKQGLSFVYELSPLRPNPARGNVTIVFEVPKKTKVTLKVYNLAGRLVRTILNEEKNPGRYRLNWQGKDDYGRLLPPGIYFLRMEGGSFRKTKKLVLM